MIHTLNTGQRSRPKAAVRPRPRLSGPIALVQAMPAWESDAVESQAALTRR